MPTSKEVYAPISSKSKSSDAQKLLAEKLSSEYSKERLTESSAYRHGLLILNALSEAQVEKSRGAANSEYYLSPPQLMAQTVKYMSNIAFGPKKAGRLERSLA